MTDFSSIPLEAIDGVICSSLDVTSRLSLYLTASRYLQLAMKSQFLQSLYGSHVVTECFFGGSLNQMLWLTKELRVPLIWNDIKMASALRPPPQFEVVNYYFPTFREEKSFGVPSMAQTFCKLLSASVSSHEEMNTLLSYIKASVYGRPIDDFRHLESHAVGAARSNNFKLLESIVLYGTEIIPTHISYLVNTAVSTCIEWDSYESFVLLGTFTSEDSESSAPRLNLDLSSRLTYEEYVETRLRLDLLRYARVFRDAKVYGRLFAAFIDVLPSSTKHLSTISMPWMTRLVSLKSLHAFNMIVQLQSNREALPFTDMFVAAYSVSNGTAILEFIKKYQKEFKLLDELAFRAIFTHPEPKSSSLVSTSWTYIFHPSLKALSDEAQLNILGMCIAARHFKFSHLYLTHLGPPPNEWWKSQFAAAKKELEKSGTKPRAGVVACWSVLNLLRASKEFNLTFDFDFVAPVGSKETLAESNFLALWENFAANIDVEDIPSLATLLGPKLSVNASTLLDQYIHRKLVRREGVKEPLRKTFVVIRALIDHCGLNKEKVRDIFAIPSHFLQNPKYSIAARFFIDLLIN